MFTPCRKSTVDPEYIFDYVDHACVMLPESDVGNLPLLKKSCQGRNLKEEARTEGNCNQGNLSQQWQ